MLLEIMGILAALKLSFERNPTLPFSNNACCFIVQRPACFNQPVVDICILLRLVEAVMPDTIKRFLEVDAITKELLLMI